MQTTTFPSGISPPKFHLFQAVMVGKESGVIVGMHYTCPLEALSQSLGWHGWEYDISFMFGRPPEYAVTAREIANAVRESDLSPLSPLSSIPKES